MDVYDPLWNSFEKTAGDDDPENCIKCTMKTYCANKDNCWMTPGEPCEGHIYGPPHVCPIGGSNCSPHCTRSGHY